MPFNLKKILVLVAFVLAISIPLEASAGFGVSPPEIIEEHLVPGSEFTKVINLVQGNPERDLPVTATIDDSNIRSWIDFPEGNTAVIPAGTQIFPFPVEVKVPENADFGVYRASIKFVSTPEGVSGAGQVTIALGAKVIVDLTVGDDVVVDYEIADIDIPGIKEGDNPKVEIKVVNRGNVPAGPDAATFELFDKFGDIRLGFSNAKREDLKQVKSFSEDRYEISFPVDIYIAPGEYRAHARIYDNDGKVLRELKTTFNVREKTLFEKLLLPVGIPLIVIIIGLVIFLFYRKRKKKSADKEGKVSGGMSGTTSVDV